MLKRTKTKMPKTKTEVRATRRRGTGWRKDIFQANHVSNEKHVLKGIFGDEILPLMWGLFQPGFHGKSPAVFFRGKKHVF